VPESTHYQSEDGFHEIQLSGKQLIFLFMATSVVLGITFLCGVLVGRDMGGGRGDEPIDGLVSSSSSPGTPETAVPEAAPPAGEPAAPPVADELSYHQRLQSAGTPEQLKPQPKPEPAPVAPPKPPTAAPAEGTAKVPTTGRPGTWVIQVQALQNRAAASSIVEGLIAKGYPAFLLQPVAGAPPIYRVQIGRYVDRREAEQVARRLEKEEQFKPDIKR
jgi:cell division septation protein DedD